MQKKWLPSHNILTIIALVVGIFSAFLNNSWLFDVAEVVADISLRVMKLVAVPLLFLSVVSSASHFDNFNEIKNLGKKLVKYTMLTTLLAALTAECLYWLLGSYIFTTGHLNAESGTSKPSLLNALLNMLPDNLAKAFLDNNVLGLVIIAICLALALLTIKPREKEIVFAFFGGLLNALMKIVHFALKFLPFSVWAFVTLLVQQIINEDTSSISIVGGLIITVIAANILQGVVVIPMLLKAKGIAPLKLASSVKEALFLAFFTRSSTATLPVTLEHSIRDAKISEDVARLSLPLCSTINMNGCAQFILLSVYFVSAFTGNPLAWWEHVGMIIVSVVAAVGNAGVPMGCFFLASSILASKNIPLHLMGSILPLYTFVDMIETSLNVWSDVSVAKIVDNEINSKIVS
ncbi:MAG: dicarboxylate/amino acid:cation symporter [Myxococcales bacterium]|nr:dicarboxylate/amino acid:cation symporter [Myxococcales bacterium]USN51814.1 MAG: dicarboxylate/amino acid:cation symporter [Myxococcales bacterium]